ncbi:NAD(P)-dependent oxidoreductase [Olivibacter sp. SDN3]|uniref:NAD(P)-dependent oxidoreductase n=1 Tax=Olivibacter sp. SDN3 TaxID=2764720 RepID=UPI0016516922|nr:NAD(P)-binding domain-containing protein [Olivibacter sp. SDN3]QNL51821.1 NAD(P)-dependent oxidoreductase [Olivibacter sp. SDN3]
MKATKQTGGKISVIGLGQMGRKIVQLYVDAGYQVTVWNRTKGKAAGLGGVVEVDHAEAAIAASPLSIIIVYDNQGTCEILGSVQDEGIYSGRTIVNFTTGSPKEATEIEKTISSHGGHYLNGAIQVAPDQMGLESTTILVSGERGAFTQHKITLNILAGNFRHLSEKAAASSAMDLATLTWLYGSYIGLIYGVKLSQEYGLNLADYSSIIGEITPGFTEFFQYEIGVIDGGNYKITQSPLPISVAATQRIANSFQELNVIQEFPQILKTILETADQNGLGNEELAAITKVIGRQV